MSLFGKVNLKRSTSQENVSDSKKCKRSLFAKDIFALPDYQTLQKYDFSDVANDIHVDSVYHVNHGCIPRSTFEQVLTTDPKKRWNPVLGKQTNAPWIMFDFDKSDMLIPRGFGALVFGRAGSVEVAAAKPTTPISDPGKALLDEEQGKAMFKSDQLTAVNEAHDKLNTMIDDYGFGSGIFVLPTGHGKTSCALHLIHRFQLRTLMVLPNIKAFPQFKQEIQNFLGDDVRVEIVHESSKSLKQLAACLDKMVDKALLVRVDDTSYCARDEASAKRAHGVKQKRVLKHLQETRSVMTAAALLDALPELNTCPKTKHLKNMNVHIVLTTHVSAATIDYDLSGFGMVIVDEAHETMSPTYSAMYRRFPTQVVVALTATPETNSECGSYMQWLCGPVLHSQTVDVADTQWGGIDIRLTPIIYRSRPIIEVVRRKSPYTGKHVVDNEAMTRQIMYCRERNNALVQVFCDLVRNENRHLVVFCTRIKHLETMHQLLRKAGIDAGILIGEHSDGTPMTPEEEEHTYRCRVLLTQIRMGHRLLNIPRMDTVVGSLSGGAWAPLTFWTQGVGRALRSMPGKNKPMVLLFEDETNETYFEKQIDRAVKNLTKLSTDPSAVNIVRTSPVCV